MYYAGILLIVIGFVLFIAEMFIPGFGLLMGAGLISLIIGVSILFSEGTIVNPWLIAALAILIGGFILFAVIRIIAVHRRQAYTGKEELIGKTAVVKVALNPEGIVFLEGELWTAVSDTGNIETGAEVTICGIIGLKLHVKKATGGQKIGC